MLSLYFGGNMNTIFERQQNITLKAFDTVDDFWANLYQWSILKVFALITCIMTSIGLWPIMMNVIEYNNNRHIK